jgi:hypothetical protein
MVSVLALCAVDRGFEPRSGQTKDLYNCICCLPAKHTALRSKSKDWLGQFTSGHIGHTKMPLFELSM